MTLHAYRKVGGVAVPAPIGATPAAVAGGLQARVYPVQLGAWSHPGGSVTLPSEGTWYIGIDLYTRQIITLPRLGHRGWVPVACAIATKTKITTLQPIAPQIPPTRIPRALKKILSGAALNVLVMGSSLTEGTASTYWSGMVFGSGSVEKYRVPGTVNLNNVGLGGTPNQYQLAQLGVAGGTTGYALTDANYPGINTAPPAGRSSLLSDADLVVIGMLANGGDYRIECLEPILRNLRKAGKEVIVCTDNPQSPNETYAGLTGAGLHVDGPELMRLADLYGCEIADTSAYVVDASLRVGLSTVYRDTIHMFAAQPAGPAADPTCGYEVWARAVRSCIAVGYISAPPTVTARTWLWDSASVDGVMVFQGRETLSTVAGALSIVKNTATVGQWGARMPYVGAVKTGDKVRITGTVAFNDFASWGVSRPSLGLQGGVGGGWAGVKAALGGPGAFDVTLTAARDAADSWLLLFADFDAAPMGHQFGFSDMTITVTAAGSGVVDSVPGRRAEELALPRSRIVADIKTPGDALVLLPQRVPTTGTLGAHPAGAGSFARRFWAQTNASVDLLTLVVGQVATVSAVGMLGASCIAYTTLGESVTVEVYNGATLKKTINLVGPATRETYVALLTPTEMSGSGGVPTIGACQIKVTAGTLRVAALVALTPEIEILPVEAATRIGTWTAALGGTPNMPGIKTDVSGDHLSIRCPDHARRVAWLCSSKPNSKLIDTWSGRSQSMAAASVGVNHIRCQGGHVGPGETHVIRCAESFVGDAMNGWALHVGGIALVMDR